MNTNLRHPDEEMDIVLGVLHTHNILKYKDLNEINKAISDSLNADFLPRVSIAIKQLVVEGFAEYDWNSRGYRITQKGEVLIWAGGYAASVQKVQMLDAEKLQRDRNLAEYTRRQTDSNRSISHLTYWIAGGTLMAALYYLLEILNHFVRIYPNP